MILSALALEESGAGPRDLPAGRAYALEDVPVAPGEAHARRGSAVRRDEVVDDAAVVAERAMHLPQVSDESVGSDPVRRRAIPGSGNDSARISLARFSSARFQTSK